MKEDSGNNYGALYNPNRFNALDSALAYIIVLVAFYVVPIMVSSFFKSFFKWLYDYDYYVYMIVSVLISQAIIFIVALVFSVIRRVDPFNGGGYKAKFDGVQMLFGMVLIAGIMMTFYYVHMQFASDAESMLGSYFPSDIDADKLNPLFALLYLILVSFLPAMIEEMMFRGIIMRGLEQFGAIAAVIVSSLAFSLMHGNFSQMILQFLGGVAIASTVILTKNWLLGSVMHFFNNLFSTVFAIIISDALVESVPEVKYVPYVADAACIVIGLTCLIVGVLYFAKMAYKKKTDELLGKKPEAKYFGKRAEYAVQVGETVSVVPYFVQAATFRRKSEDERSFFINGKFRKLNSSSNPAVAKVLLSIGLFLAIVSLFL
ncbi:MAG: CPBP family intramembrane metalloprotease [Clostridia bacterium]|nr:CPBP family intramembrane metalloprotease [Clostridia bacterium]